MANKDERCLDGSAIPKWVKVAMGFLIATVLIIGIAAMIRVSIGNRGITQARVSSQEPAQAVLKEGVTSKGIPLIVETRGKKYEGKTLLTPSNRNPTGCAITFYDASGSIVEQPDASGNMVQTRIYRPGEGVDPTKGYLSRITHKVKIESMGGILKVQFWIWQNASF